jgi:hypothetical protein
MLSDPETVKCHRCAEREEHVEVEWPTAWANKLIGARSVGSDADRTRSAFASLSEQFQLPGVGSFRNVNLRYEIEPRGTSRGFSIDRVVTKRTNGRTS